MGRTGDPDHDRVGRLQLVLPAELVEGIERGRAEIDVAPLSLRAGVRISSLAPLTFARIQRRLGSAELADAIAAGQRDKR